MSKEELIEKIMKDKTKDMFKGASVVPELKNAQLELKQLIHEIIHDSEGALHAVLDSKIEMNTEIISMHIDNPKAALKIMIEHLLKTDSSISEFVRCVDQKYGELYGEKPMFETPGSTPDPDDPYTIAGVKEELTKALNLL